MTFGADASESETAIQIGTNLTRQTLRQVFEKTPDSVHIFVRLFVH